MRLLLSNIVQRLREARPLRLSGAQVWIKLRKEASK